MKCRSCGRKIEDNSIFCNWCGEKQLKVKKKKDEIRVPAPKQRGGNWNIYLRAEGASITEKTPDLCVAKAKAVRAGFLDRQQQTPSMTYTSAIESYIKAKSNVLSPATIRGYDEVKRNRFKAYHNVGIAAVDWQQAVNEEAAIVSPKTVANAWGLVSTVLRYIGVTPPDVTKPMVPKKELPWLDYKQVLIFLGAVRGKKCELAALLALHSLRRSELLTITPAHIKDGCINVQGAAVRDITGTLIAKETNKNQSSARSIPIMIPRLSELIMASDNLPDQPYVSIKPNKIYSQINTVCRNAGLPEVGVHGLRRSFASLAYHLGWQERETMRVGGWSDFNAMHKFYIKLDQDKMAEETGKMSAFYASYYDNLQQNLQQK